MKPDSIAGFILGYVIISRIAQLLGSEVFAVDNNTDMKRRLMLSVSAFAFSVTMLTTGAQAAHTGDAELTNIMNIAGSAYSSQLSQNKKVENGEESAEYEEYKKGEMEKYSWIL